MAHEFCRQRHRPRDAAPEEASHLSSEDSTRARTATEARSQGRLANRHAPVARLRLIDATKIKPNSGQPHTFSVPWPQERGQWRAPQLKGPVARGVNVPVALLLGPAIGKSAVRGEGHRRRRCCRSHHPLLSWTFNSVGQGGLFDSTGFKRLPPWPPPPLPE